MRIAVAQLNSVLGKKDQNIQIVSSYAKEMAQRDVDLILFPEMSITGYDMTTIETNASLKGDETYNAISDIALKNNITIAIGLSDKRADGLYNTLTVFNSHGKIETQYDKTHLFTGAPVKEQNHLAFGKHLSFFEIKEFTAGLQICYDIRFPELSRSMILKGANLLLVSAAWPKIRREHWVSLLKARAIENQCYVAAANRSGTDKELTFAGSSMIISPTGDIIKDLDISDENSIYCDLDINLVKKTRETLTVFNDRREEIYRNEI